MTRAGYLDPQSVYLLVKGWRPHASQESAQVSRGAGHKAPHSRAEKHHPASSVLGIRLLTPISPAALALALHFTLGFDEKLLTGQTLQKLQKTCPPAPGSAKRFGAWGRGGPWTAEGQRHD